MATATGYEVKAYHDLTRLADAAERIATALEARVETHECEVTQVDLEDLRSEINGVADDLRAGIDEITD